MSNFAKESLRSIRFGQAAARQRKDANVGLVKVEDHSSAFKLYHRGIVSSVSSFSDECAKATRETQ